MSDREKEIRRLAMIEIIVALKMAAWKLKQLK